MGGVLVVVMCFSWCVHVWLGVVCVSSYVRYSSYKAFGNCPKEPLEIALKSPGGQGGKWEGDVVSQTSSHTLRADNYESCQASARRPYKCMCVCVRVCVWCVCCVRACVSGPYKVLIRSL